jgi:hypothetical protein
VSYRISSVAVALLVLSFASPSQQVSPEVPVQPGTIATNPSAAPAQSERKRIFGIIPNYRTAPSLTDSEPLTRREKFKIATEDSVDPGTFILAGLSAGVAQLTNANRSFGQGAAGHGKYFGTAYGDLAIGNYMTEAIYPSLLHQDPRYFRRGSGSGWSRFRYAVGQIIWTHRDSGDTQFNYSELIGSSTSVAITNAYYSDNRTASDAVSKLGIQVGFDAAANVLKEFWPDLDSKFTRKRR